MATDNIGRVVQIIGPVVDVEFGQGVPPIYSALRIEDPGRDGGVPIDVIVEDANGLRGVGGGPHHHIPNWIPVEADLQPTQYRYHVPPHNQVTG